MIRDERSASHRITSTAAIVTSPLSRMLLHVANWSSFIGTSPVSRTRAW